MNILVLGSNGREHALAAAYTKSRKVTTVFLAPGNGLTDFSNNPSAHSVYDKIKNTNVAMTDFDGIVKLCRKEHIDLVDVAQDDVIAAGFVDRLEQEGITAFGPSQKASQLEWDKAWARDFMTKYHLPIPSYHVFSDKTQAIAYMKKHKDKTFYIKAAGLALGKGVIKAENLEQGLQAIEAMQQFGKAGETFLIEEALVGEEFSLFVLCDGRTYIATKAAQDHKTVYEANQGPNTGGVGSVAPAEVITKTVLKDIEKTIIKPVLAGMSNEGRPYKGILYLGGMLTHSSSGKTIPKIIEFNARWGDPEAEVILPSIQTDYLDIVLAIINGKLGQYASNEVRSLSTPSSRQKRSRDARPVKNVVMDNKIRISIAGCARGYPTDYSSVKGKQIFGLENAMKLPGITIYGSGIKREGKKFFVNGGRIFHVVAEGETIIQARVRAYGAMSMIHVEGDNLHYRTDIGYRDLERFYES